MPADKEQKSNKETHLENLKHATIVARNSLLILVALTILKAFGGYVTNIIALVGDAVGSFTDIIGTLGIYVGLRLSQQKASDTFKYGYHRVETLSSLFISIFTLYLGYKILMESYGRFFVDVNTTSHGLGIITAIASICISFFTFYYQKQTGERINSKAFLASAYDKRNDAVVSFGVLVSVVGDQFKIPYVEGTVGVAIALLILWTGLRHSQQAIFYLLDYWDEPQITEKIRSMLVKSKIVTSVKNIRLRHAGTYIFGEAFLEVNPFTDSKDLRDELHRLDNEVENNVEHLGDLVIYIDPPKPVTATVAIPISHENGLQSNIADDMNKPFNFFFVEIENRAIQRFYTKPDKFSINQISAIAKFLKEQKVNILITGMIRPLLYYNMRLNNIKVYPQFFGVKEVLNTVKLLMLDI